MCGLLALFYLGSVNIGGRFLLATKFSPATASRAGKINRTNSGRKCREWRKLRMIVEPCYGQGSCWLCLFEDAGRSDDERPGWKLRRGDRWDNCTNRETKVNVHEAHLSESEEESF